MSAVRYTLDDVSSIKQNGFSFELPKKIQQLIMDLSRLVGSPDYIKTPVFKKKTPNTEPDWDLFKKFKPTAKVERSSNEELLQKIKGSLNKMTDKNYGSMKEQIFENLSKLEDTELFQTVSDTIFDIASSNRFYSKIYAMLFKDLISNDSYSSNFKERLMNEVDSYLERYSDIKNINANDDYEGFCDANKVSEKRKALTEFFTNLMNEGILDVSRLVAIHENLCELTLEHKFSEEHKQTIIEISENMYVLVKNGVVRFREGGYLDNMIDRVAAISNLSVKQHPGLSNKASFKFMDITDIKG